MSNTAPRTWAQRRLIVMQAVARYWQNRTGPATGYALDAASMRAIADRACLDIAGTLIAKGCRP